MNAAELYERFNLETRHLVPDQPLSIYSISPRIVNICQTLHDLKENGG